MKERFKIDQLKAIFLISRHYLKLFLDKKLSLYAASLSFYTVFTLIPLLLIVLTIFTKLPMFEQFNLQVKTLIYKNLMPTQTEYISGYIESFLLNSDQMGTMGVVFILISSVLFFQNFEYIASKIYKTRQKEFWDSITTYWTFVTLSPIALAISFYLSNHIKIFFGHSGIGIYFFEIFPFLIVWLLFFVTYKISAHLKIKTKPILVSSFVASITWYTAKSIFVSYVFYNDIYNTIYGSFSILLFFFLWIYISWIIFLYGMKLCFILNKE